MAASRDVDLPELQRIVDEVARGSVRLGDPVWASAFHVHHRHAATYRSGRVFLAGDAAHIHSPAGGQGMNTGIQDAINLGWKLALVTRGAAAPQLLDTYDAERRPVGEFVLRFTDRAFTLVTSPHLVLRAARTHLAPRVLPLVLRLRAGRRVAFRTVSQLGIRYRDSAASGRGGRQAGDRLPDAPLVADRGPTSLHQCIAAPTYHLLLIGPRDAWDREAVTTLVRSHPDLVTIHHVEGGSAGTGLQDVDGLAQRRLGAGPGASIVVRPDGHIGCRGEAYDLTAAQEYLSRWLRAR